MAPHKGGKFEDMVYCSPLIGVNNNKLKTLELYGPLFKTSSDGILRLKGSEACMYLPMKMQELNLQSKQTQ